MDEKEMLELIKKNIFSLHITMMHSGYAGFKKEHVEGMEYAIQEITKGTGITFGSLEKEQRDSK